MFIAMSAYQGAIINVEMYFTDVCCAAFNPCRKKILALVLIMMPVRLQTMLVSGSKQ